jgi:hypothetical protein
MKRRAYGLRAFELPPTSTKSEPKEDHRRGAIVSWPVARRRIVINRAIVRPVIAIATIVPATLIVATIVPATLIVAAVVPATLIVAAVVPPAMMVSAARLGRGCQQCEC